jgi:hypothetical protein
MTGSRNDGQFRLLRGPWRRIAIPQWVHLYNAGGPDAVSYHRTGGRVAGLSVAARDLLSNPSTAGLSDREIARRAGVSPTTVGKLRRDLVEGI